MNTSSASYLPADVTVGILDLTVGGLLREASSEEPARTALIEVTPLGGPAMVEGVPTSPRRWTYAELLAEAEQAAQWLLTKFAPGEHVCVWAPNIAEWVILQYGAALAGLVLVTANPALRSAELEYILNQSKSVGIVYVDTFRGTDMAAIIDAVLPRTSRVREAIRFATWNSEVRGFTGQERSLPTVLPTDAAQVQYTSGTTGFPKGAMLHHRGLITNAAFVHRRAEFPRFGVWATALPLFHTAGSGMSVLGTAASRGTLVLIHLFEPKLVLEALQDWKADLFGGVPAMYAGLLANPDFDKYDLTSVMVTASGGDAVPSAMIREVERRFGSRFTTVYGQTELSPILAQTSPHDTDDDRYTTTGRPLWQAEIKIVDAGSGLTVSNGEQGEICARGYQLMLGYFDMPDETRQTIDAEGWLHTGDIGTLDSRGYLRVTGRLKDMIIRAGENIYPREIEANLIAHPGVAGVAVIGVTDEVWGESIVAIVIPADPAKPPPQEDLRQFVRQHLAPHKTPQHWYLASALPANSMGKIQNYLLRDQVSSGSLPELP
jgi:acyl-CoA synthetase (AMP-forming)/AMP-acid ligase II